MSPELRYWFLIAALLAGYALLLFSNPIRVSLRDGFRCLCRYPAIWSIPAAFGVCYSLFHLGVRVLQAWLLPEGEGPVFQWARAWFLPHSEVVEAAKASVLTGMEGVAGIFNNIISTFPLSAVAAFLLLVNWQGHHGVLNRALRKRYGRWGWPAYFGISICAIAAVIKPLLYAGLPMLGRVVSGEVLLPASQIIEWLSFIFEYLFGVCIQIYLILLVYVWVRGVSFTPSHLLDFAIRRFSSVMKWAALVLLLSSVLINLPLIVVDLPPFSSHVDPGLVFDYVKHWARPLLALFLIFFATPQITLTFHSESFRQAVRDHFRFVRKNALALAWFLMTAFVTVYGFHFLNSVLVSGLGEGTALGILWLLAAPTIQAFLLGWLLASWVCVFKRADTGRSQDENWVAF